MPTRTTRGPRLPKMPPNTTRKGKNVYGSLTKSADLLDNRVSEVSNVSKTVAAMQKNVNKKVRETRDELDDKRRDKDLEETHKSINSVLSKLGDTIAALGTGITNVTIATAKATKDAVGQYASAVGRDINYNKQNIVAMALSQSTPIFGYFAAKFMETDVFRKAKEKITSSMSNMFGAIFRRLRFKRKGKKDEYDIPHMARGGIVKKAGMAKLHAAEVVMPVDKYLKASQKSQEAFTNRLAKVQAKVFKQAIGYETLGGNFRETRKMSYQDKMLELVGSIEKSLYNQSSPGFFKRMWDSMMKNSIFKGMIDFFNTFKKTIMAPFRALSIAFTPFKWLYRFGKHRWRVDRGYWADLPKGRGVLESMNAIMGMTYAQQMSRLDSIILYTKATAQAVRDLSTNVTGIHYPSIPDMSRGSGGWSIFGVLRKLTGKGATKLVQMLAGGDSNGKIKDVLNRDLFGGLKKLKYNMFTSDRQKEIDSHSLNQSGLHGTSDFTGAKTLVKTQRNYYELMSSKKKGMPKLIGYNSEIVDELREINRREKRRTAFGFLKSILGGIGNIFSGIGKLFLPTGALGLISTIFGALFGKGGGGAKGGIIGNMIGNAGRWVGRIFKQGFWGFVGMFAKGGVITKTLGYLMKPIQALGTTILTALTNWAPKLLPFLKTAGWIGLAATAGWEIGTLINEKLGLGAKIQGLIDKLSTAADKINPALGSAQSKNIQAMSKSTNAEDIYQSSTALKLAHGSALVNLQQSSESAGAFSSHQIVGITAAQRQYIMDNMSKYLPYSVDEIQYQRNVWLKKGGLGFGQSINYTGDPLAYGERYESEFLKFLEKNGTVMDSDLKSQQVSKFAAQAERNKNIVDKVKDAAQAAARDGESRIIEVWNSAKGMYEKREEYWNAAKGMYERRTEFYDKSIQKYEDKKGEIFNSVTGLWEKRGEYTDSGLDFTKKWGGKAADYGMGLYEDASEKASEVFEYTTENFEKKGQHLKNVINEYMAPVSAIANKIDDQTKGLQKSVKDQGSNMMQSAGVMASSVSNAVTTSTQTIVNNNSGKVNSWVNTIRENLMVLRPDNLF